MERQLIIDKKNCPDYETIYFVASASAPKEIRDHLTHLMVEKIDCAASLIMVPFLKKMG